MYTLWDMMEYACTSTDMYFSICNKYKPEEGVFKLPFKKYLVSLMTAVHEKGQLTDIFLLIYWITFIFGIIGLMQALYELGLIASIDYYEPRTFGNRTYEHIPLNFRRSARVFGSALNVKLYISLLYGMLSFRTSYILPWVVVYGIILPLEIIYWACDVFFKMQFNNVPAFNLLFLVARWALTHHIRTAMNQFQYLK